MVVGLFGSLFGSFLAIRNFGTDVMLILFSDVVNTDSFFLLEALLSLLYLAALVASVTLLLRKRVGVIVLVACTVGVVVFGGLELYLYLNIPGYPQDLSLFAAPLLYPVIAAPFLLVASVFAFLGNRRGERSLD